MDETDTNWQVQPDGENPAETPGAESQDYVPTLLSERDLPGPLSMQRLEQLGAIHQLDETNGYWSEYAATLFGRAQVVAELTPNHTIACAQSAAWVWLGGKLPNTVDVLSGSHYRSLSHGRRVRVFNRRPAPRQLQRIGRLRLTGPTRTAVDLASIRDTEPDRDVPRVSDNIVELMEEYRISAQDCLTMLDESPHLPTGPRAKQFFEEMLPATAFEQRPKRRQRTQRRSRAAA